MGSSSYITDKEGKVIQHTEYMAFGEVLFDEHSVSKTQPYLFNGKELDYETGLYYYGARYYDPKTSIFLNVDPLVEKTGTPYTYVNNNPVNLIDPTGMEAEDCPTCPTETYLQLSKHVYTDNLKVGMKTDNNWEVVKVDRTSSGHVGAVYKGTHKGKTEYIYASKGTTMSSLRDWDNNISQAETGFSAQYYESIELAKEHKENYPKISFTGHSKGGGQAKVQAMAVGAQGRKTGGGKAQRRTQKRTGASYNPKMIK